MKNELKQPKQESNARPYESNETDLGFGRREFLFRSAMAFGAAASLPLIGCGNDIPSAPNDVLDDPDELFRAGWFEEADLGYQTLLAANPDYAHALARRGYIALLSNRFGDAEMYLTQAIAAAPQDDDSKWRLSDTFVRQDKFDQAVPLIREAAQGPCFDAPATITHEFYKTLAITFDFTDMTLYIRR